RGGVLWSARGWGTMGMSAALITALGGGLSPPPEAAPPGALRAAGRPWAGPRASEASHRAVRAAGRPWAGPRASEASHRAVARAKPALEADHPARGDRVSRSCVAGIRGYAGTVAAAATAAGSSITKRLPWGGLSSTPRGPPWSVTI